MQSNFVGDLKLDDFGDGVTFRPLNKGDIPAIIQLGAECFYDNNQSTSFMVKELEDTINFMSSTDQEKVIEQGLSIGAFKDNKLISYAIGRDQMISVAKKDFVLTEGSKNLMEVLHQMSTEFVNKKFELGECFFLYLLMTDKNSNCKNLATKCFNEVCKMAQQRGFTKFLIRAWHPGTKRITEKNFKETTVLTHISDYKGNKVGLWAIYALF